MSSRLEIVNHALTLLGAEALSSFEDDTAEARAALRVYDRTYAAALSAYRWACARVTTTQLPRLAGDTPDGRYRYGLPAGWLTLVALTDRSGARVSYRLEGPALIPDRPTGDTEALFLSYVQPIDEGQLPEYLARALAYELAAELAMPLTENATRAENLRDAAAAAWRRARIADSQSEGMQSLGEDDRQFSLLTARG